LLENTAAIDGVDPKDYDAVFLVGGQSPMFTFRENPKVQQLVADFYEAGKITALVCHATCALLDTRLSTGELLVNGKTWTGFANAEEAFADNFVGQRIQPFWIEDEARKIEGSNFVVDQMFRDFAVRDGRLVTGQQQFSGAAAARLVIEALGR
jgi:putative intracellular protease/amidase